MNWLTVIGISVLMGVILSLLMRVSAVNSRNPRAFSAVYNSIAAVLALGLYLVSQETVFRLPPWPIIGLTILAIIMYGIFERTQYFIRKRVEASVTSILFQLAYVVSFSLSIIVLGESFTVPKAAGAGLIIGGNLLIAFKNKQLKFDRGWWWALVPPIAIGVAWTIDKVASSYYPLSLYSTLIWAAGIIIIVLPKISVRELGWELKNAGGRVWVMAVLSVGNYYLLLKALSMQEASRVIMVFATQGVLVVLAGIIFLRERTQIFRKIVAACLVFGGILLLR